MCPLWASVLLRTYRFNWVGFNCILTASVPRRHLAVREIQAIENCICHKFLFFHTYSLITKMIIKIWGFPLPIISGFWKSETTVVEFSEISEIESPNFLCFGWCLLWHWAGLTEVKNKHRKGKNKEHSYEASNSNTLIPKVSNKNYSAKKYSGRRHADKT